MSKTRAGRGSHGRVTGCLCHKPGGVVKRHARDRYLPMPRPEDIVQSMLNDAVDTAWSIYDRQEERFLETDEALALPEGALMTERLRLH